MKKRLAIAIGAACAAMLLLGASMSAQAAAKSARTTGQPAASVISSAQAEEIALKEVGGGKVKESELDREKGKLVYEVEIRYDGTEYEVYVDAASGTVIGVKAEYSHKKKALPASQEPSAQATAKPQADIASSTQISRDRAREIALERVGGGTVREVELERKKGKLVYEIEIKYNGREYDVKLDAATGEVLRLEIDD